MTTYEITGPDGKTVELQAPEGATPEQIDAKIAQIKSNWGNLHGSKTSATGAFLTGVGQAAFGLGDEIEAGVRAALDPDRTYSEVLPEVRKRVDDSASEHPVAYYGGQVGASLAIPGAAARLGFSPVANAVGQGLTRTMRAGALEGGAYGAAYGFGSSEGGIQNRAEGAVGGGVLGTLLGGAAPVAIGGVQAAARPIRNSIAAAVNPEDEAARRLREVLQSDDAAHAVADNLLGQRNPEVLQTAQDLIHSGRAGQELRNIDMGGQGIRAMARSAANNSPEAREVITQMTNNRFQGQGDRTTDFIRNLIQPGEASGPVGNTDAARRGIQSWARGANNANYTAARRAGDRPLWSPTLERLTGSPTMRQAMQRAVRNGQDRAILEGYGAFNPGVAFDESGMFQFVRGPNGVPTYPNLQYWDYVKRELDDIAGEAGRQGADGVQGNAAQLARNLREELDNIVPEYARARGTAANYFNAEDALEAGGIFARPSAHNINEVRRLVGAMPENERRRFTEGYINELLANIERTGDRRNILGRLAQSTAEREKLNIVLGPQRARELEAFLYIENLMDLPRNAMGNSTTARQLVELGLAGGSGMLASGGDLADPTTWIVGALTRYGISNGRQVIDQRMARRIAEMLVSQDPQVMQQAVRNVAAQPRMLGALRGAAEAIAHGSRVAPGIAAGAGAAQQEIAPGYADGGAVRDLPRLSMKPALMEDDVILAGLEDDPMEDVRLSSPAIGVPDQRGSRSRGEGSFPRAVRGGLAGMLDMGGATSKAARYLGADSVADWLAHDQDKAPISSLIGSIPTALPGILYEAGEGVAETIDQSKNPKSAPVAMTRDEFFRQRRKPRETLEEAAARAEREFRASPAYIDLNKRSMVKVANRELTNAVERAKQTWRESQSGLADEEAAIESDYQAYLDDINKQLEAENAKGFSERNPWFKTAVGLGSIASGGLAALGLRSIAKKGDKFLDGIAAARKSGDAEAIHRAEEALKLWDRKRLPRQAVAVGLPATIPMDIRGVADVVDAYGTPQTYFDARGEVQPALANVKAREHLEPKNFIADSLPAIASGLIGAGVGAKFAKKAPVDEVGAAIRPLPTNALDDIAAREATNAAASGKIAQARQALADEKKSLETRSRIHERQLARSETAARRSSPASRPAELSPQSGPGTTAPGRGQVQGGGGTTKALPSPAASKAVKNKLWDDVESALKSGKSLNSIKASDYQGLTDKMLSTRLMRVNNLLRTKSPKALGKLIKELRANDSWPLGVAGAAVGAGAAMNNDKEDQQ